MGRNLKDYPGISLKESQLEGRIDFKELFGRDSEVHIEIGGGKGTWLLAEAKAKPEADFLGIEWARKYYRYTVDRLGRWGIENVRVIRTDSGNFIQQYIADESVDVFHVYFPDPWPKKRHHKRRFFCQKNLDEMRRCLKPGGVIQVATDHEDYYEWMRDVVEDNLDKFREVEFQKAAGAEEDELVGTNYERKYKKEGRTFHYFALRKI